MDEAVILTARQEFELANRPKGRVWQLEHPQFVQVVRMLMSKLSYERVAELCLTDLKLPKAQAPSYKALWKFWGDSKFWMTLLSVQQRDLQQRAKQTGKLAEELPANWEKASEERIHQRAFELSQDPAADPTLALDYAKASLHLRRLKLDQDKADRAQESKVDAGISALCEECKGDTILEELIRKLRDRFNELGDDTETRRRNFRKVTDAEKEKKLREIFGLKE